jgi:hypothetical protein
MAQVFSQSLEYDKLKEDWELKKQDIMEQLRDLKIGDSDRVLAGKVRALVANLNAIVEAEESFSKYFDNKE